MLNIQKTYKMLEKIKPVPNIFPFVEDDINISEKLLSEIPVETLKCLTGKLVDRVGCIPYSIINGRVQFLLGKSVQGNISDFGGGRKKGEDITQCIIREISEEFGSEYLTNIVNMILIEHPDKCIALDKIGKLQWRFDKFTNFRSVMILVPIPYIPQIEKYFVKNEEMEDIGWIHLLRFYEKSILSSIAPALYNFLLYILLKNKIKLDTSIIDINFMKKNYHEIYGKEIVKTISEPILPSVEPIKSNPILSSTLSCKHTTSLSIPVFKIRKIF